MDSFKKHREGCVGGHIEVICGPMFSGKTEELLRRIHRAVYAKQKIQVFKPKIDNRYDDVDVTSHNQRSYASKAVDDVSDLKAHLEDTTYVVVIDEIQFFDASIITLCEELADEGRRVIVAGLDLDYSGKPFEIVAQLLARAEDVLKLTAICVSCGAPATRSFRTVTDRETVLIGSEKIYEARCRRCYLKGRSEEN